MNQDRKARVGKLVQLRAVCDLETGVLDPSAFEDEKLLYEKGRAMKVLATSIRKCTKCDGMNIRKMTEAVSGWGNLNAEVMIVGQSLHGPGMVSGVPFVGGSGVYVLAALYLSRLKRRDCFWSNVVHCHPEKNRASTEEEKTNCLSFLKTEIKIIQPRLIVALGNDAKDVLLHGSIDGNWDLYAVKHPAALMRGAPPEQRVDWIVKLSLAIDKTILENDE